MLPSLRFLSQIRVLARSTNSKFLTRQLDFSRSQFYSTEVNKIVTAHKSEDGEIPTTPLIKKQTSKAMKAYLERAKEHDEFMKQQNTEYQIGKRHLANMMGMDPETFTQDDIDDAIAYLFPSGIYDKKARPMMKHPEEIFPQRKAAEFDETGRPHHFLFYTGKPNYYQLLHDIVNALRDLNKFEDQMIRKTLGPDPTKSLQLAGSMWFDKADLSRILLEKVDDRDYEQFQMAIERLAQHPYSYRAIELVQKYRKPMMSQTNKYEVTKVQYDETGRGFVTTYECLRKTARGDVTVFSPGTGKISINGQDINYFKELQSREQLLFPLQFTEMEDKVDVVANVEGGGTSGQAGAIRWGISMCLRSFVDQEMIRKMHVAGLLQRDYRTKERKKPGQKRARKKFTWKKR